MIFAFLILLYKPISLIMWLYQTLIWLVCNNIQWLHTPHVKLKNYSMNIVTYIDIHAGEDSILETDGLQLNRTDGLQLNHTKQSGTTFLFDSRWKRFSLATSELITSSWLRIWWIKTKRYKVISNLTLLYLDKFHAKTKLLLWFTTEYCIFNSSF